jgi:2-polyprenyl-6-methoxyphenol hydroxylase-like FAD-dependent oxidoreductase
MTGSDAWVLGTANILLEEGRMVVSVTQVDNGVRLDFSDGTGCDANVVISADGYHSRVRQSIAPPSPWARYAGYLVWRGLVEERMLKRPVAWPSHGGL